MRLTRSERWKSAIIRKHNTMKKNPHTLLMLGNLFYDEVTHSILRVDEIKLDGVIFYVVDRNKYPLSAGWQAKPIALLPHIMPLIGFKEVSTGLFIHPKFEPLYLIFADPECHYLVKASADITLATVSVLHDLQNIFLVITGEHLDVSIFDSGKIEI